MSKGFVWVPILIAAAVVIVGGGVGGYLLIQNSSDSKYLDIVEERIEPKEVILQSSKNLDALNSYNYSIQFDGEEKKDYSLTAIGKVGRDGENREYETTIRMNMPTLNLTMKVLNTGGSNYINLLTPLTEGSEDIFPTDQWIKVEMENTGQDQVSPFGSLTNDDLSSYLENLTKDGAMVVTDVMDEEIIMGKSNYHFTYTISDEVVAESLKDFGYTSDTLKYDPIHVWIRKEDKLPSRVDLRFFMEDAWYTMQIKYYDYNTPVDVVPPANYTTWEQIFEQLTGVSASEQFAQARDTQRQSDLLVLTNAIYQYAAEHDGNLPGTDGNNFPQVETCIGTDSGCFDLATAGEVDKIVPTYVSRIPVDPSIGTPENTGYTIYINSQGRVVATAKGEKTPEIMITR